MATLLQSCLPSEGLQEASNMNPLQPSKGMTSVQAAQAYLQDEQNKAAMFDMEVLARSGIARTMGFPFSVTIEHNRFICIDDTSGYKTTAFYDNLDEKAIKRLVRALMRLKKIHDTPKEPA